MFSFQRRVIVNLLLRVSYGVKTSREKHELHTAVKAGKPLNSMGMTHCLKIWRPKKHSFLSIHGKFVQLKQKTSVQIRNQIQKIGWNSLSGIFWAIFFPSLVSEVNCHLYSGYILSLIPTPTFSPPIIFILRQGRERIISAEIDYISSHVFLHHFLKRGKKHQSKA